MTVICASPTLTVRHHGVVVENDKPVAHSVPTHRRISRTNVVRFNERVRLRRTIVPKTVEEFRAIWYTETELFERRRKDKKLRYAIARQPDAFGAEKLLTLGLHTEDERRHRCKRALAARSAVLLQQSSTMELDSGSDSDDSSTTSDYSHHSQKAAVEALQRALYHAAHVQTMMDNEDDSSTVTSQAAVPQENKVPAMEMEEEPSTSSHQIVVCA